MITWPSSTIAKCCSASSLVTPGSCASWPRCAISLVVCWKTPLPVRVEAERHHPAGRLAWNFSCGLVMSLPSSTESSVAPPLARARRRRRRFHRARPHQHGPGFTRTALSSAPFGALKVRSRGSLWFPRARAAPFRAWCRAGTRSRRCSLPSVRRAARAQRRVALADESRRLAARSTAWYSSSPEVEEATFSPPVTLASVGAGLPSGPITFGSQS